MTLKEFRRQTAEMPSHTRIIALTPWGELTDAIAITVEDLAADDPVRDDFPPDAIAIASKPD
jgi:hypothetical protein